MEYEIINFSDKKILISLINGNQVIFNQDQYQKFQQSELDVLKGNQMLNQIEKLKEYNPDLFRTAYISLHTSSQCNMACTYCFKKLVIHFK
ncbi:MAG: hypothetical protein KKG64_02270 [Firmicutes bacterium]|nr:hypothetical protein [Bacillota bacterium]